MYIELRSYDLDLVLMALTLGLDLDVVEMYTYLLK